MQTVSIIREKFMKKIIVTFIATITAALLLCFSVSAFDNNDYGGGGGYDFQQDLSADTLDDHRHRAGLPAGCRI